MNEVSKLEVNAAIEHLIESSGSDAEARAILAAYATTMQSDSSASMDLTTEFKGGSLFGATPDNGNVKIDLDAKRERQWKLGDNSSRVGYYKLSRITKRPLLRGRNEERIIVTYFWKADLATASDDEESEAWCLSCDKKMQPVWFGKIESFQALHLGGFSLIARRVKETWGPHVGNMHDHDVHIRGRLSI